MTSIRSLEYGRNGQQSWFDVDFFFNFTDKFERWSCRNIVSPSLWTIMNV